MCIAAIHAACTPLVRKQHAPRTSFQAGGLLANTPPDCAFAFSVSLHASCCWTLQYPDAKMGEISKIAGERWKALEPPDKLPYQELQAKLKEEYVVAMKVYRGCVSLLPATAFSCPPHTGYRLRRWLDPVSTRMHTQTHAHADTRTRRYKAAVAAVAPPPPPPPPPPPNTTTTRTTCTHTRTWYTIRHR